MILGLAATLSLLLGSAEPAVVRPRLAMGVVGAVGFEWKYSRFGCGPGVGIEAGVTLNELIGLVARGVFASSGIFTFIKTSAAVAFDLTARWTLGVGVGALVLGDVFSLAHDLGPASVGIALPIRAEYRIPLAPAASGMSHGLAISLEAGPGITLRGAGGYCRPASCPEGTPISIDGAFGVAYVWR